ncbi:MAG: mechanosensitive ion channel family protein [Burkholderiaceae bacterium]
MWDLWSWLSAPLFWRITPLELAIAAVVTVVSFIVLSLLLRALQHRLAQWAGQTRFRADDVLAEVLGGTHRGLLALVSLLIGAGMIEWPPPWPSRISQLWFVVLALQIALWANRGVTVGLKRYAARNASGGATVSAAATLMSWGLRTLLWSIVALAILSNLGVNITAFVASMGVGGIAIALAAQNILGDLFASMSIAVDKPFEVGDFIAFGEVLGSVEHVGVKTTRLRSLGGEQIVIGNTDLLKQTIRNYKRMQQRRILFTFNVAYGCTPEQAERIPVIVREAIEASERLRFDRAHLLAFGESALRFEVVYFVLAAEYNVYMDEQQRINLRLMRELAALGARFAQPVRIVHVASAPSAASLVSLAPAVAGENGGEADIDRRAEG